MAAEGRAVFWGDTMGSTTLALVVATVGVTGTLLSPLLAQRVVARVQAEQFDREQRAAHAQWLREQQVSELIRRRDCYVTVNAAFRLYRTRLMDFLWDFDREQATPEGREAVEEARRDHHSTFAEAQLIVSGTVLVELDGMTAALSEVYRRIMSLAEGHPDADGSFEEIRATDFPLLWERWDHMRNVMRADLGVGPGPEGRPPAGS